MNRKRLKETGNYLAMVILIMEFPVFSVLFRPGVLGIPAA